MNDQKIKKIVEGTDRLKKGKSNEFTVDEEPTEKEILTLQLRLTLSAYPKGKRLLVEKSKNKVVVRRID